MTKRELVPAQVPPPGQRLKDELEKRLWTQEDLARVIDRPLQLINAIVSGRRQITPTTALELGEAFDMSPKIWAVLESDYQLHLARERSGTQGIARRSELFEKLPVREMVKRGWLKLKDQKDQSELENQLVKFGGVNSLDQLFEQNFAANFYVSDAADGKHEARGHIAWQLRVRNLARRQQVSSFDRSRLGQVIEEMLTNSLTPAGVKKVPQILKDAGIRFVIVPHFSRTYLDGAAFHIDDEPVVAMTLRYDRLDNFWFVLLHELSHLYCDHEDVLLDEVIRKSDRPNKSPVELEADEQARSFLVDKHSYQDFVEATYMDLTEEKINAFAKKIKRHPSIVIGRLHRDRALHYSEGRHYLEKVSQYLKPYIDS